MRGIDGRRRVIIEGVAPEIDGGLFPIKRAVGEEVIVEADVFADGHDVLGAALLYRPEDEQQWAPVPMLPLGNDRWRGAFTVSELKRYVYTLRAWIDGFATWRRDLAKKVDAGQDVGVDLLVGAELIAAACRRAAKEDAERLETWLNALGPSDEDAQRIQVALDEDLAGLMARHVDLSRAATYEKVLSVDVDRRRARYSTWYEMFPRSCTSDAQRHGTFADCEARLGYVAAMGFDVLYLPPIHPIGTTHRKGKNNRPQAAPDDVGSPWAIGSADGGHAGVHPELGTLEDFRRLVAKAEEHGIEIALDIAYQCSPDHPYVREHPEWFRKRPDGTIQYAENPPKKYQDIYPLDFETDHWRDLWEELRDVVLFWVDQGVRIFRVDNPHTKSMYFWEWLISDVRKKHPEVLFLSEAFTRPKVRYQLAKRGFSQSYTYFPWRNTKSEITEYFTHLTQSEVREYFRPHHWPNTPDILNVYLQYGGRPAFLARLVLAATLGANYGIYGPPFELCEHVAREPGSEEYLDSEKYQIRVWDLDRSESLKGFIARVNAIRRGNPALQRDWNLTFHDVHNEALLCYSKQNVDPPNLLVMVVNLDPHHTQSGWVELRLDQLGLDDAHPYQMHDLLSDSRFLWSGARNYVELNPHVVPAHVFRVRHRVRSEEDFEYYL